MTLTDDQFHLMHRYHTLTRDGKFASAKINQATQVVFMDEWTCVAMKTRNAFYKVKK